MVSEAKWLRLDTTCTITDTIYDTSLDSKQYAGEVYNATDMYSTSVPMGRVSQDETF